MGAGPYALCTLDDVKNFMSKIGTDGDDNLFEKLIDRVSALFESYVDVNILSREYTEHYDGQNATKLFTKQFPITVVSGIWDDREWAWGSDTEVDSDSYRIDESGRYIVFKDTYLLDYSQNVKIIYTAGHATVPYDLVDRCIIEVARKHKNKDAVDITAEALSDGSISYTAKDLLPQTRLVLNNHRRKF